MKILLMLKLLKRWLKFMMKYLRKMIAQTLQESAVGVQARHLGRPLPANPRRPGGAAGRRAQAKSTCLWID
ncbi:TPA: hypothetical protein ACUB4M_000001, partial [Legionella pneumophila]